MRPNSGESEGHFWNRPWKKLEMRLDIDLIDAA
jgi:hypothetical protein